MAEIQKVEISLTSYLKLLLVVLGVVFVWQIRDIVVILFIAFILVQALNPAVIWLGKRGIPRLISLILIYLSLVGVVVATLSLIMPPLIDQLRLLEANVPYLISKVRPLYDSLPASLNVQQVLTSVTNQLGNFTGDIVTVATRFFGGLFSVLMVFVISFYLLIDEKQLDSLLQLVIPSRLTGEARRVLEKIGYKVGGWVRGQILINIIMGLSTWLVLSIIGMPYALTIGVLAAVFETLPVIGPIVVEVIAIIIALGTGSWGLAIAGLIAFTLLQQLEGHFIVPNVMRQAVGLSPVVIIVSLLVGATVAGLPGAMLAVPSAAVISVLVDEWANLRKAFERLPASRQATERS